eukprot:gene15418-biopygen6673
MPHHGRRRCEGETAADAPRARPTRWHLKERTPAVSPRGRERGESRGDLAPLPPCTFRCRHLQESNARFLLAPLQGTVQGAWNLGVTSTHDRHSRSQRGGFTETGITEATPHLESQSATCPVHEPPMSSLNTGPWVAGVAMDGWTDGRMWLYGWLGGWDEGMAACIDGWVHG